MNRLRNLLKNDQTILTAWCGFTDRFYIETIAKCGFDAVTLDMQHGLQTESSIIDGVASIATTGKPAIVRVPVGRFEMANKALDIGAHAVIAPMINTVDDARAFASQMKYPPLGERSHGVAQAVHVLGCASVPEYLTHADADTMAFAMIETKEAVGNLEAILGVDGIDGILVGPSDLSISYRATPVPDAFGEATIDIIAKIAATTRKANKTAAIFGGNPEKTDIAQKMGYRLIALGFDSAYIGDGANTLISQVTFR